MISNSRLVNSLCISSISKAAKWHISSWVVIPSTISHKMTSGSKAMGQPTAVATPQNLVVVPHKSKAPFKYSSFQAPMTTKVLCWINTKTGPQPPAHMLPTAEGMAPLPHSAAWRMFSYNKDYKTLLRKIRRIQ